MLGMLYFFVFPLGYLYNYFLCILIGFFWLEDYPLIKFYQVSYGLTELPQGKYVSVGFHLLLITYQPHRG